jgi:clan AA aspartic protease
MRSDNLTTVPEAQYLRPEELWELARRGEAVGEIRVKVRLVNAVDEALARRGQLPAEKDRSVGVDGVVDTGAVRPVIPASVVQQLGLGIRGQRAARYADGRREAVDITEPLVIEILGRDTLEEALVQGDQVLIGQTVLEKLDLWADCAGGRLVPNPANPDQPVSPVL